MEGLWKETKKHELIPAVGDEPAFVVTLKHIGSKEDPFHWNRMQASWTRELELMRIKVRKELLASYGTAEAAVEALLEGWKEPSFAKAVAHWLYQSDAYIDALSLRYKKLIVTGIAGGEDTYHEIHRRGGLDLLTAAAAAVVRNHEVSAEKGKD